MPIRRSGISTALTALAAALVLAAPAAAFNPDVRVSAGSPFTPFSQNKQNEPAMAVDAAHPWIMAAGSNDEIDMEACNAGDDHSCPFTPDVGVSGVYFSMDSGTSWHQPNYTGTTARNCLGVPGDTDPGCTPSTGPIGTLPNYDARGMVSDGDPALAFGPAPAGGGGFSWAHSRLYYVNLTSPMTGAKPFSGAEAIAVSHTDDVASADSGSNAAWSMPVVASKQNGGRFSDKEQVWADNAQSSHYFGNVYVCYAAFQGNGSGTSGQSLHVITSRDGGNSWTDKQVTSASSNSNSGPQGFGRTGCSVRTDSRGTVYVFAAQLAFDPAGAAAGKTIMITSPDGGQSWSRPRTLFTAYDLCNYLELSIGRCVEDGVGGARADLGPAPSVDIANGAPSGVVNGHAPSNRIVMAWADGRDGLNNEDVKFTTSGDSGQNWSTPVDIQQAGDRGYYAAPAISPNGTDVYVVYNAWLEPFKTSAVGPTNDRPLVGVVEHADVTSSGVGAFTVLHRSNGAQTSDARGSSQNNLAAEFLGDYVYAVATPTYGAAVWNDVRNSADCPAIDAYRQALHDQAVASGGQTASSEEPRGETDADPSASAPSKPAVEQDCPANFGESDIYGGSYPDPTP